MLTKQEGILADTHYGMYHLQLYPVSNFKPKNPMKNKCITPISFHHDTHYHMYCFSHDTTRAPYPTILTTLNLTTNWGVEKKGGK